MQAAPEFTMQWKEDRVKGVIRWLSRLWSLTHKHLTAVKEDVAYEDTHSDTIISATHKTIKHVSSVLPLPS